MMASIIATNPQKGKRLACYDFAGRKHDSYGRMIDLFMEGSSHHRPLEDVGGSACKPATTARSCL
jgi:hypothetical protein